MKKILFLSFVFYSTIIGVGFATGAEIMIYFTQYGIFGLVGLLLSCVLMAICGAYCMKPMNKKQSIICAVFCYIQYVAVLAASSDICSSLICDMFGTKENKIFYAYCRISISLIFTILSFIVLVRGFSTLVNIIGYVTPLAATALIIFVTIAAMLNDGKSIVAYDDRFSPEIIYKGVLYAGYNVLGSSAILSRMNEYTETKRNRVLGSIFGILIFFISAVCVFVSQIIYTKSNLMQVKMPSVEIVSSLGLWAKVLYVITLIVIMNLTMFSGLSGTCGMIYKENTRSERRMGWILALLAIPLSFVGFTKIIAFVYPVFGIIAPFVLFSENSRRSLA